MNYSLHKYCVLLLLLFYCFDAKSQTLSTYYTFNSNVYNPYGLSTNSNGVLSYVVNNFWPPLIKKINSNGINSTFISGNYYPLNNYYMFYNSEPTIMTYDDSGNLYFIDDYYMRSILKVEPNGTVTTLVSNYNYYPSSITCDNLGNLYFIDDINGTIYKVDQFGTITTLVNNSNYYIKSITCDNSGNLYFVDDNNYGTIQKVDQYGTVSLFINNSNYYFKSITSDNSGNIYFIDQYTYPRSIQKINPSGIISPYITNNLNDPKNLIADNNGNLFFIDYNNGRNKIMTVTNSNNICTTPNSPTSSDTSICGGNTIVLTANGIGEMNWYDASSGGNLLYTGNDFTTPIINSDITYYVEAYYCNLSSNRTPVIVTKLETPVAVISGNTTGNDVVSLIGSGIGNYLWSDGFSPTQAVNYFNNSGTYTLTVTNNSGCSNSTNISVIVNELGMSKFGKLITDTTYQITKNGKINADTYLNKHGKLTASKIDRKLNYKIYTSSASYAYDANGFLNFTNETNKTSFGIYNGEILLDWSNWSTLNNVGISIPNNGERFSVQVSGYFCPLESGNYTFTCEGDDAVDLFINGVNVANHYGAHGIDGLGTHTGTINLVQGTKYTLRARMQENGGGEGLRVLWRKPSQNSGWYMNSAELSSF